MGNKPSKGSKQKKNRSTKKSSRKGHSEVDLKSEENTDERATYYYEYDTIPDELETIGKSNPTDLQQTSLDNKEVTCSAIYSDVIAFSEIEVKRSTIELIKKTGKSHFGEEWTGKYGNSLDVTVKVLNEVQVSADVFISEAKQLHQLQHRNLVPLLAVCTGDPYYVINEAMRDETLLQYLRNDDNENIDLQGMIDIASNVADGMAYLEMKNYIHLNLRAARIFMGKNGVAKIADLGIVKLLSSQDNPYGTVFAIKWIAPEVVFDKTFTVKADVWSFGIVLYEIMTKGQVPYPDMDNKKAAENILSGYRMPKPHECPDKLYEVMCKCWLATPECRPTFDFLSYFFGDYHIATEEQSRTIYDSYID